jgi:malonate-semialdehyde dehydrogenase (acetylating) / methylmalonate-semialdehyde dehydrogenase
VIQQVENCVNGRWYAPRSEVHVDVVDPATGETLARTPESGAIEVAAAVDAAERAFPEWRNTPAGDRVQFLFKLKQLLETYFDELARLTTQENGKTLNESRGELRQGIENVEVACGIPILMQGYNSEDIARGIDEMMIRQPLGVWLSSPRSNFPTMIPLWFLPYAIACGNTVVMKPSEKVPLSLRRVVELLHQTGLPPGVVNLVNGMKGTVDALLDHPKVRAVSFVGSTAVARYIYARAASNGKRMQCQGGAKNHVIVLPDADMESATLIIADGAFGCAGQRCLAISVAVTVGGAQNSFKKSITEAAQSLKVGNGLDESVQMGPVISPHSRERIEGLIAKAVQDGGKCAPGRPANGSEHERGNLVPPTVLDGVSPTSEITDTEIFGPVLNLVHAGTVDEAIDIISRSHYVNQASIFTTSGAAPRKFRNEVRAGNIGINIGVAAPVATFPFSGWKDSFFGCMHAQGRDAIEFYTDKKVVVERWPSTWSRKF